MFSFIINTLNAIIKGLGKALAAVMLLFPNSPFQSIISDLDQSPIIRFLGTLNYFLPISEIVFLGTSYLACITIYYVGSTVARWVKAIE